MKKTVMKILMMTGVLVLMGQAEAIASSTKVTFQVPIRVTPYSLVTGGRIACDISHRGARIGTGVFSGSYLLRYAQRSGGVVPVVVNAQPGKSFQKGDQWTCYFGISSAASRLTNTARSTLRVNGTL